jgi:hypothetical protein
MSLESTEQGFDRFGDNAMADVKPGFIEREWH